MSMKKLVLIITLFFTVHLYSQEIPLPLKCFPLNNTDSGDIISGQMADIHGSVYALADRFGVKGKALSLGKEDSYLSFPINGANPQGEKELTFTYWMYAGKDSIAQTFWAKDRDGNLLLGMGKRRTNAVLNIYHEKDEQSISSDQQWMWSDSNFAEGEGWYFVAVIYSDDGTRFYLGTPKGKMTECYSAFTPDWNLITEICIGTVDDIPAAGMDDFKVYDVALSKEQVSTLYHSESQLSMGNEALLNVGTGAPLYSSTWYFHCVGLDETFRYVMQNQTDLSFLSAEAGYALAKVSKAESDYQQWSFSPVSDTAQGRIFTISNCATGMNLTDMRESVLQQASDNTDSQKWCVGQIDANNQTRENITESNKMIPLYEEIYFDKSEQVIRVHINFPEVENVKIRLTDIQGVLFTQLSLNNVILLDKNIKAPTNGVYIVAIEAENYRLNRKIFVNN